MPFLVSHSPATSIFLTCSPVAFTLTCTPLHRYLTTPSSLSFSPFSLSFPLPFPILPFPFPFPPPQSLQIFTIFFLAFIFCHLPLTSPLSPLFLTFSPPHSSPSWSFSLGLHPRQYISDYLWCLLPTLLTLGALCIALGNTTFICRLESQGLEGGGWVLFPLPFHF